MVSSWISSCRGLRLGPTVQPVCQGFPGPPSATPLLQGCSHLGSRGLQQPCAQCSPSQPSSPCLPYSSLLHALAFPGPVLGLYVVCAGRGAEPGCALPASMPGVPTGGHGAFHFPLQPAAELAVDTGSAARETWGNRNRGMGELCAAEPVSVGPHSACLGKEQRWGQQHSGGL